MIPSPTTPLEALTKARDQFLDYARQHRAKNTVDGDTKATINETMAAMCNDALPPSASAGGEEARQDEGQLIQQARDHIARTWTAQGWRAEQSIDHPGYWDLWTLDATGQRRIILARFLTANVAGLMCFVSTALPQLCDLATRRPASQPDAHSDEEAFERLTTFERVLCKQRAFTSVLWETYQDRFPTEDDGRPSYDDACDALCADLRTVLAARRPTPSVQAPDVLPDVESLGRLVREKMAGRSFRAVSPETGVSTPTLNRVARGHPPNMVDYLKLLTWLNIRSPLPNVPSREEIAREIDGNAMKTAEDWAAEIRASHPPPPAMHIDEVAVGKLRERSHAERERVLAKADRILARLNAASEVPALRGEVERLREALVNAAVPLEAIRLVGKEAGRWDDLSWSEIINGTESARAALTPGAAP